MSTHPCKDMWQSGYRSLGLPALLAVSAVVALTADIAVPQVPAAPAAQTGIDRHTEEDARSATIRRDRFGVPHIVAETEAAAAFAHGYVTAEDHGAELAQLFLHARGALASVFGERDVEEDFRVRTLGIYDEAAARFEELPPFMRGILNGYAAGYSFYLNHHRDEFPSWATPVTGVDVLAHARATLLLDFALDLRPWAPRRATGSGSNMWAIGRALSASGRGMLLANPHVRWGGSTVFHEVHLTVPGLINISGATFIGVPVVTIGFNDYLGWSHTVNQAHSDDVYELTLDATQTHYMYDGEWLSLRRRPVSVEVKSDAGTVTQTRTVFVSHYGPVARIENGRAYAFKSPNLTGVNFLTQWNAMAKATSLQAFTAAVNMQQLPTFNLAYADRDGNIWYLFNGRIPIRPSSYRWSAIVPGNTSKTEWFAVRPVSELPQLLNPKSGYVQNCNDAPWYTNLEQRIDRTPFADYVRGDSLGWRSQESLRILSAERALTLERLMRHKFDATVTLATRLKGDLLTLVKARDHESWREGARVLEAWDNETSAESRGAVFFLSWWDHYAKSVPKPFQQSWSAADPIHTPAGIADPAQALLAFDRSITKVTQQFGALDISWGEIHRLRRGTLDLPLGGMPLTIQNVMYRTGPDGKFEAVGGDSYILAVEFAANGPRAFSIVPHSQSSNPRSVHFTDQTAIYAREQFKPAWFTETDIVANLGRRYHPDR